MSLINLDSFFFSFFLPFMFYFYFYPNNDFFRTVYNKFVKEYQDDDEDEDEEDANCDTKEDDSPKIKYYENKYLDEFRSMKDRSVSLTEEDLLSLKNSFVVEYTPVGNVAMFYDHKRETFCYYSDTTMPYRFLEVVGRKYVMSNNCKSIFVDMSDELKQYAENKQKQKELEEQKKLEETKRREETETPEGSSPQKMKKNVFAKFKSYNNNNTKSSVTVPAKEAPKIISENEEKKEEDMLLKEKSNRYTCEGRFSNFAMLKKVDKKALDKRLAMTFAEFKKMQETQKL